MLFNSLEFLVLFLPIVLIIAFSLRGSKLTLWICLASTFFYAYAGHTWFLIPMFVSATLDFWMGRKIENAPSIFKKKLFLWISLVANLALLAYFKYSGLFFDTLHSILGYANVSNSNETFLAAWRVILPAGISFYTFQTMSYVIDIYRGDGKSEKSYLNYFSFVSFFPHLVAGPLTRHNQLIPQIKRIAEFGIHPRWKAGIFLFTAGLAKKVLIADRIGNMIDPSIQNLGAIGGIDAWLAIFGYAFQIYFDFSGYTDMAIGLGRLMQVEFPLNFNSPYQATSPSDFWKRWHITLSQWLRDYLYISLGGNQCSPARQKFNLMVTMLLGGLWHGASWNFMFWGMYHGSLLLIYHQWQSQWDTLHIRIRKILMFVLVCLGWVFFRSPNMTAAKHWFEALFFFHGTLGSMQFFTPQLLFIVIAAMWIAFTRKNTSQMDWDRLPITTCAVLGVTAGVCILLMNYSSKFLYFQF